MSYSDFVSVTIVTYNSGRFIKRCLESVLEQKYPYKEIIVIDNCSTDGTTDILEQFEDRCQIVYNEENIGFAAAQNQAIGLSSGDWVLTLNPDVLLLPDFIQALVNAGQMDPKVGSGLRQAADDDRGLRHPGQAGGGFDRHLLQSHAAPPGSRQPGSGQRALPELRIRVRRNRRRRALSPRDDRRHSAIDGEFFDSDFFVYREDADVAWRAQLMGWRCLYAPYARGYHVRNVLPGKRRALPPEINMHSVKNRFLLRMKNISGDLYRRNWFSISVRDVMVVACCLVWEHTSLKAFWYLAKNWKRILAKRREIQRRQRVDNDYIASWFKYTPVSKPAPRKMAGVLSRSQAYRS